MKFYIVTTPLGARSDVQNVICIGQKCSDAAAANFDKKIISRKTSAKRLITQTRRFQNVRFTLPPMGALARSKSLPFEVTRVVHTLIHLPPVSLVYL